MPDSSPRIPAQRIAVLMPNWLGDGVMATPFLRALRTLYPDAHIAALARSLVAPVLVGSPLVNDLFIAPRLSDPSALAYLRQGRFDLALLLPNSFRAAWAAWRAKIPHRVGYARGGRSWLLTSPVQSLLRNPAQRAADLHRAAFIRAAGGPRITIGSNFQPTPTIDFYLRLAEHLGADNPSRKMELTITPAEVAEADAAFAQLPPAIDQNNLLLIIPGANFGAAKCWPPEYFGTLAHTLAAAHGISVLIAASPSETPLVNAILQHAKHHPKVLSLNALNDGKGLSLGALKEVVRRSQLMLSNDTGPRYFAPALGKPVVTVLGPTDPVWSEIYYPRERIVRIEVPCGPCQLKQCPIDHRCMKGVTPDMVLAAIHQTRATLTLDPSFP